MSAIIESGNDYLLAVKQNQPKLHRQLQQNADESRPIDIYTQTEKTRNRITQRLAQRLYKFDWD
ncbi:hypothetical protein H6F74_15030 [Trichocoleus sp. FACHB-90]|uniref:hypothetical protein n=1 Tax=Cyanophyceae TaxID=3028117 RepID=UPI001689928B|nr:hypothetical protein [Trichocoleus sp. FACHB-90]MBD1927548.1 hypothetical protein [Trichocoleus sp. FACHB-90]